MTFDQYLKKQLKDPEFKKEWDALEPQRKLKRRVIELRMKKEMTQKQLAKKLDTKQSAISRLEKGMINPTIDFLNKLASAFGKKLVVEFK